MTKKYISIISFLITVVAVILMLGIFEASNFGHALSTAENNFTWMVFLIRLFLGLGLEVARIIVSLIIIASCFLFYLIIRELLAMAFIEKHVEPDKE